MVRSRLRIRSYTGLSLIVIVLLCIVSVAPSLPTIPTTSANPQNMPWHDKSNPFGVVTALGNRVRVDEIDTMTSLMREAGVQWQREEIFWHEVQQVPSGPFNWTGNEHGMYNYDYAIESQVRAGINVLGLLDYNPAWFKGKNPLPEEWINDWGNFVYNAVARYGRDRGWITYWELWNEPNLAPSGYESGLYDVRDFVRVLQVGAAAARAADPEAKIVMAGLAPTWTQAPSDYTYDYFDYLERVAIAGGFQHVDVIAIHPYRPGPPEGAVHGRHREMDLRIELEHLDELLVKYGIKPVWITELGWSTHKAPVSAWPSVDLDTQAFFLIRSYVLAITHPSVEKVFWYDFRNDTAPNAPYETPVYSDQEEQFHYGLLRRGYPLDPQWHDLRKPSFLAYRAITNILGGLYPVKTFADGNNPNMPGVYWYRFSNDSRHVDIIWRTYGNTSHLTMQCDCKEAMVRNWKGELKGIIYTNDGNIVLPLEAHGTPMYVEYDAPSLKDGHYFDVTGHSIRGSFYQFWANNGGVYRFGYPLTDEIIEPEFGSGRPRVVQYFDRTRFTLYPEFSGTEYEIQLAHLGPVALQRQGVDWQTLPKATNFITSSRFFTETGHSVSTTFLYAWEKYGGLRLIGYPISEQMPQTNPATGETYIVQYFERARLEYFPSKHIIEFGLLGRELFTGWSTLPSN